MLSLALDDDGGDAGGSGGLICGLRRNVHFGGGCVDKALRRMVRWAHNRRTLNVGRGGATSGCRLGAKRFNLLGLNAGLASVIKYPAYVEGTIYFNAGERANPPFAVRSAGAIHGGDLNAIPVADGMVRRAGPGIGRGSGNDSHESRHIPS